MMTQKYLDFKYLIVQSQRKNLNLGELLFEIVKLNVPKSFC